MEIIWRVISRGGENGGKGTGNNKHQWQVQNRQGEVKNSIGNGEAKELICTTHGHELRWGVMEYWWEGAVRWRGIKVRKKWDNCNSIINKIYFKKRNMSTMTYLLGQWGMHVKCRTNIKTQTQSYKGFKYRTFETGL